MSFAVSTNPLDPAALARALTHPRAGACVTFEGWVRDHNDGRPVHALEYEAFTTLAEQEGNRILDEARQRFDLLGVNGIHRAGLLKIGDLAVWIGVTAVHRGAAFDGCRYVIDELKSRLPIWKKEHYADGATAWVNCATRGDHVGTLQR